MSTPTTEKLNKFSHYIPSWNCVDADGCKYEQVSFDSTISSIDDDICIESDLYFAWSHSNIVHVSEISGKDLLMNRHKLCRKIEPEVQETEPDKTAQLKQKLMRIMELTNTHGISSNGKDEVESEDELPYVESKIRFNAQLCLRLLESESKPETDVGRNYYESATINYGGHTCN